MDAVKKRDADLLAMKEEQGVLNDFVEQHAEILAGMSKALKALTAKIADMERKPQYEKTTGV
jgi:uncharacterized coiled-coil protein SlyX